jgi:4-diphosphocytidyl-2-C-methyl-D-erythritol kinase
MPTRVRSYSKINLGLAIGAPRADGFHSLATLYQTLALHDVVTVIAQPALSTRIVLRSSDPRVPCDGRNTAWKMVEAALDRLGRTARIEIHIQKNLPIQGGMGAGSANAAAALIGLERELGLRLDEKTRLELGAQVGSDVPLFLIGGSVLGSDRGQVVEAVADVTLDGVTEIDCVIALPAIGVSTPAAFRDWDRRFEAANSEAPPHSMEPNEMGHLAGLLIPPVRDRIEELSRTYASVLLRQNRSGASGILPDPSSGPSDRNIPEKPQGLSREQLHASLMFARTQDESGIEKNLAENSLLALVRTGIESDFETVVFPQYPLLREIKRHLMGTAESSAVYAALSGSGSALFGLYRSQTDASAAQQRLQQFGVEAIVTKTMPRARYWSEMFAE